MKAKSISHANSRRIQLDISCHLRHLFCPLDQGLCPLLETQQSSIGPRIWRLHQPLLRQRIPDRHHVRYRSLRSVHALLQLLCHVRGVEYKLVSTPDILVVTFERTIGFRDVLDQITEGIGHTVWEPAVGGQRVDFVEHADHVIFEVCTGTDCEGHGMVLYSSCSVAGEKVVTLVDKIEDGGDKVRDKRVRLLWLRWELRCCWG